MSSTPRLGLDHLVGTAALKPYMHGYFMSLKLYDAARVIANPFVYAEHRDKMIRDKMEKMAETRIRTKKDAGVKVNKALAEKILREEEKAKKREERKKKTKRLDVDMNVGMNVDGEPSEQEDEEVEKEKPSILNDPRFAKVFENPEFAIDETSREYALLNPSAAARERTEERGKTAVEDEEEESDKFSSDGLDESSSDDADGSDSSDAGGRCSLLFACTAGSQRFNRAYKIRSPSSARPEERPYPRSLQQNSRPKSHRQCQICPYACSNRGRAEQR
jgi:ribosome biogenesis protein ENP2